MRVLRTLVMAAALLAGQGARADDYPTRPITVVVPTGPGGGMEMVARLLAPRLEQKFRKPLVIENRPGAGTKSTQPPWRARRPTATRC